MKMRNVIRYSYFGKIYYYVDKGPIQINKSTRGVILSDKTRDYTYTYAHNLSHRLMHKMYSTNFNKTKRMLVIYKKILDKYLRKALDPHDICYSEIEKQEHEFKSLAELGEMIRENVWMEPSRSVMISKGIGRYMKEGFNTR